MKPFQPDEPNLIKGPSRKVGRLIESVGSVDAHGPAYQALDPELAEKFSKAVMRPESDARKNRTYGQVDLNDLLEQCLENLDKLIAGTLVYEKEEKEKIFQVVKEGTGWVMIESDNFVFDLIYGAGHTRAVAMQRQPDGSIAYTIAKKSELVGGFPVGLMSKEGTLLYELSKIEPGWGGGSTVRGAPRNPDGSRSRLSPEQVFEVIERIISKK